MKTTISTRTRGDGPATTPNTPRQQGGWGIGDKKLLWKPPKARLSHLDHQGMRYAAERFLPFFTLPRLSCRAATRSITLPLAALEELIAAVLSMPALTNTTLSCSRRRFVWLASTAIAFFLLVESDQLWVNLDRRFQLR
jgi:hypothetical protein